MSKGINECSPSHESWQLHCIHSSSFSSSNVATCNDYGRLTWCNFKAASRVTLNTAGNVEGRFMWLHVLYTQLRQPSVCRHTCQHVPWLHSLRPTPTQHSGVAVNRLDERERVSTGDHKFYRPALSTVHHTCHNGVTANTIQYSTRFSPSCLHNHKSSISRQHSSNKLWATQSRTLKYRAIAHKYKILVATLKLNLTWILSIQCETRSKYTHSQSQKFCNLMLHREIVATFEAVGQRQTVWRDVGDCAIKNWTY